MEEIKETKKWHQKTWGKIIIWILIIAVLRIAVISCNVITGG